MFSVYVNINSTYFEFVMALDKKDFTQRDKYYSSDSYKSKMKRDKAFQTKVSIGRLNCK